MIYSESRSDTELLNDLEEANRVFLLGCPACANACLYLQNASEDTAMFTLTPTGYKAVSMIDEVGRLKQLLYGKGLDVDSWVAKYPTVALCVLDEHARKKIVVKCQGFDTIVTLSCDAGTKSVQSVLPGKRVIGAMQAKGILTAKLKSKMRFAKLSIDKSTVDILRFSLDP
jgi:hypothetical protein